MDWAATPSISGSSVTVISPLPRLPRWFDGAVVDHVNAVNPRCVCGKPAGHRGICRLHGHVADELRRLLRDGHLVADAARRLGISFERANRIGRPYVKDLRASGHKCLCGADVSHAHRCVKFPERGPAIRYHGLADRAADLLREGLTRAHAARYEGVADSTISRLVVDAASGIAPTGDVCRCGQPLGHPRRCKARYGRSRSKPQHSGAALDISAYKRRRVAHHARRGESDREIARRLEVAEGAVRAVIIGLVSVGQAMGACPCGLPRNHTDACRNAGRPTESKRSNFRSTLPAATVASMRRMYRSGMSAPAIQRKTGVSMSAVLRHIRHWKANELTVKNCPCGRPARHAGGCSAHNPRSLSPRWRRYVHSAILAGTTTREIADLHGLTFASVLPHTRAARAQLAAEGRTCACGKAIGHPGACWATYKRIGQPRRAPVAAPVVDIEDAVQDVAISDHDLLLAIGSAVPARISRADRDELVTELYLGVRSGTIKIGELALAAKRLRQRAFFASRHAPASFDREIFADGGATLHDVVSDTTAATEIDAIRIGGPP